MLIDPNITKKEFSGILCGIDLLRRLADNVQFLPAASIASQLQVAIDTLERSGIDRVVTMNSDVKQEHDVYYKGVRERNGLVSNWAVYETGKEHMGNMPFAGNFSMEYTDEHGTTYGPIALEEDASWLSLWKSADSLIKQGIDPEDKVIVALEFDGEVIQVKVENLD